MRVVFISPFLYRFLRGIERYTIDLANALAETGVQVDLITWKEKKEWPWGPLHRNVCLHALKLPKYFQDFFAMLAYISLLYKLKPDIVNVFFTWHGEEWGTFFLSQKTCLNLNLHYPADQVPHRYQIFKKSLLVKRAEQIIAVSDYVAREAMKSLKKIPVVIHNGINTNKFYPVDDEKKLQLKRCFNIPENNFVLLTVGALEERKRHSCILKALARIKNSCLTYLIIGEGPLKERLMEETNNLSLDKNVRFLDATAEVMQYYQTADAFIFLSAGEAFGLVLLEAMACGLPLIVSGDQPYYEFIPISEIQFVEAENTAQVSNAILNLMSDPTLRKSLSLQNRIHAEKFDWAHVANQYLTLFKTEIINHGQRKTINASYVMESGEKTTPI